jgi:hypothetical protein
MRMVTLVTECVDDLTLMLYAIELKPLLALEEAPNAKIVVSDIFVAFGCSQISIERAPELVNDLIIPDIPVVETIGIPFPTTPLLGRQKSAFAVKIARYKVPISLDNPVL